MVVWTTGPATRVVYALLGTLMLAAPAEGGADQTERRPPYLRLFTGIGITRASDLRIRQPSLGTDLTFEQVPWEHRSLSTDWTLDSVPYVGARVGLFLRNPAWLSLSFEAVHFKVFASENEPLAITGLHKGSPVASVEPMAGFVQTYQVSNGVNLALVNLQAHRPLTPRAELYGGLGGGVTIPFTRSVIDDEERGQYEWGRPAVHVLAGLTWHGTPRWDLSVEYKFTATTVDGSVAFGDSRSRLRTHHLTFGIGLRLR